MTDTAINTYGHHSIARLNTDAAEVTRARGIRREVSFLGSSVLEFRRKRRVRRPDSPFSETNSSRAQAEVERSRQGFDAFDMNDVALHFKLAHYLHLLAHEPLCALD